MKKAKETATYAPGKGRYPAKKAQVYGEELERIAKDEGGITPDHVVQVASDPDHIFHDVFEWDDTAAAHQYRLEEARHLIRWVEVEIKYVGSSRNKILRVVTQTRAFQNVTTDDERAYQPFHIVKDSSEYRRQVMDRLGKDLERIGRELKLYENLERFSLPVMKIAKRVKSA